ncbi:TfoX/Sxy family protein [Butyricicoccus sp.]|uniref:TfoX/Sxy family protein n=1 Tax=Butyricicoccus sp. TaxID=2049021 RepID=UPI003F1550F7
MASSKEYLNYILEQIGLPDEVSHRAMMGEYVLYYQGKIFGYICDDRLLFKPVAAAKKRMPDAPMEPPYDGAKEMLLVQKVDDGSFLRDTIRAMADQLPEPKPKKRRK